MERAQLAAEDLTADEVIDLIAYLLWIAYFRRQREQLLATERARED